MGQRQRKNHNNIKAGRKEKPRIETIWKKEYQYKQQIDKTEINFKAK